MGVPDQPSAAAAASGKVFCCMYPDVGVGPQLLCRGEQLLWRGRYPTLPRRIRGGRDAGVRSFDVSGVYQFLVFGF